MQFKIYDFLDKDKCNELVAKLQTCSLWQDGKLTTGEHLKDRKSNNELVTGDLFNEILDAVFSTFYRSEEGTKIYFDTLFNLAAPPMINKYNVGEEYGWHFDETIMPNQNGQLTRMDYSYTIFLNDNYKGGELIIEDETVKGEQGQIVIYDNKLRHRVNKITEGTRYACFGWLSSMVQDVEVRNQLSAAKKIIHSSSDTDNPLHIALQRTYHVLLKKFT